MILSAGEFGLGEKPVEVEARRLGLPLKPWRMAPGFNPLATYKIIQWAQREGFELMHSHGYKFNVLMGVFPEFIRKSPLITTLHGYVRARPYSRAWLYELLDRLMLRQMRQVIMVSESIRFQIPKRIIRSGRASVITNGLNTSETQKAVVKPIPERLQTFLSVRDLLILGVGRLSPEKGFDRLIDAFKDFQVEYPNAALVVVGEGGQRAALEKKVRDYGLDAHVQLPGYVAEVAPLMRRADVLCISSFTEGLPITLLEAMLLEVPIVASDVGEIGNVLGEGKGGRIFRYGSSSPLAEILIAAINERSVTGLQIRWSKRRVEEDFSARAMMERYLSIYQRVLA